jgi:hypothetical protein
MVIQAAPGTFGEVWKRRDFGMTISNVSGIMMTLKR